MLPEAQAAYKIIKQAHAEFYSAIKKIPTVLPDEKELADIHYAMKECVKFLEDMRSEARKVSDIVTKCACMIWMQEGGGDPIRSEYCTATPDVKQMTNLPRKSHNPERFATFMTALGIDEALWNREGPPAVELNWNGMVELVSERLSQGLPLPEGIDPSATYSIFKLHIRGKKGVEEL